MPQLICPLCRSALSREEKSWRCAGAHCFDIAREGYLNLLPVQHKNSRAPGDNPDMVNARHAFLGAGHYTPLRDAVLALLRAQTPATLLDIGCGEGWYTAAMATVVADVVGIDIARNAVQRAAKAHRGITWLVASSASLPLADASVALVSSLFSPLPAAEMARVLAPGGQLLVVTPAAGHLASLRAALFDEVTPHRPEKFIAELAPAFRLQQQQEVTFPLALDNAALQQLLLMTPYAWRAKREKRDALAQQESFADTAAFSLLLLQRSA